MIKIFHGLALLIITLVMIPNAALAQQDDFRNFESDYARDQPRGPIQITNDWQDTVTVTMWTHRRERIGGSWEISAGETVFLFEGRDRIKVRPNYKIKVGDDWGWVNLGDVGYFQRGVWRANVRDIWRATHQRGGSRDGYKNRDRDKPVPDWKQ